jgi:hypothetical protein
MKTRPAEKAGGEPAWALGVEASLAQILMPTW